VRRKRYGRHELDKWHRMERLLAYPEEPYNQPIWMRSVGVSGLLETLPGNVGYQMLPYHQSGLFSGARGYRSYRSRSLFTRGRGRFQVRGRRRRFAAPVFRSRRPRITIRGPY